MRRRGLLPLTNGQVAGSTAGCTPCSRSSADRAACTFVAEFPPGPFPFRHSFRSVICFVPSFFPFLSFREGDHHVQVQPARQCADPGHHRTLAGHRHRSGPHPTRAARATGATPVASCSCSRCQLVGRTRSTRRARDRDARSPPSCGPLVPSRTRLDGPAGRLAARPAPTCGRPRWSPPRSSCTAGWRRGRHGGNRRSSPRRWSGRPDEPGELLAYWLGRRRPGRAAAGQARCGRRGPRGSTPSGRC